MINLTMILMMMKSTQKMLLSHNPVQDNTGQRVSLSIVGIRLMESSATARE
jgi:hypothetical protein